MGTISDLMKKYGKTAEEIIIEIEGTLDKLFDPSGKAKKAREEAAKFNPKDAIKKAKGGMVTKKKSKVAGKLAKRGYGKAMKGKK
jgi:hypothetical protein